LAGYHTIRWWASTFLAVAPAALWSAAARAELSVSSVNGCPDEAQVHGRIAEHSRKRSARQSEPDGELLVERAGERYRARVRLGDAAERVIDGDDCVSVVNAAALVVGMSMASDADDARESAPAPPATPEPMAAERPHDGAGAHRPSASRSSRIFGRAGVLAAGAAGLLPAAGFGGTIVLGAGAGPLGVEVTGSLLADQTATSPSGLVGSFGFLSVGVRPCLHLDVDPVEITPCIGVAALRFTARGEGTDRDRTEIAWSAAPSAALGIAYFFSRYFGLRATFHTDVVVARPRFVIENDGPVHVPAALVGGAALGPEVRF
jgi:hypothetical protein